MENIWNNISYLGTSGKPGKLDDRTIVLTNQVNFIMMISMFFLLIIILIYSLLAKDPMSVGTIRVAALMIVNFINLLLARFGFIQLCRFSLIFLPPVVFLLGPTLIGYVEKESYIYYPYTLIAVSIIPQLLLHPVKEKFVYWVSMGYYFALVLSIDILMIHFDKEPDNINIVSTIKTFYTFYKIAPIGIFLFINANIHYLRMLSIHYEDELNQKNDVLNKQNVELLAQKDEIERQKDELIGKEISTWQKLVHIISHEIVNSAIPITNLAGITAQMLEDESGVVQKPEIITEEVTEDIHYSLKIIESRTQGLINFVKATKSLTDIPKPNLRKVLISDLFERVTMLFQSKFKESGITFEKQINPSDFNIEIDLELIEQVIINLFQNAFEAMHNTVNPRLSLVASLNESGHKQISISDNGTGIDEEILERIFLPFYSTKPDNSGIGLSLSQQIMMLHHARLEVVSVPGQGSTFMMIF